MAKEKIIYTGVDKELFDGEVDTLVRLRRCRLCGTNEGAGEIVVSDNDEIGNVKVRLIPYSIETEKRIYEFLLCLPCLTLFSQGPGTYDLGVLEEGE